MDHREMENLIDDVYSQIKELRETKGKEYATEEDTLADFKDVALEAGITPFQCWATYVKKHQRAIDTFIREGGVKSESIESRIVDVIVYHLLLLGLIRDLAPGEAFAPERKPLPCGESWRIPRSTSVLHEGETVVCELPRDVDHRQHYGRTQEGHGFSFPPVAQ